MKTNLKGTQWQINTEQRAAITGIEHVNIQKK